MQNISPIGIFDSGFGGLTIMKEITALLPEYDYYYLGDNARTPYGTRSFETVYKYTLESVKWFFDKGCPLVIIACNTASAKALREIQQIDLPEIAPEKKVLGIVRPTSEIIGTYSTSKKVGIMATTGTVLSDSYPIEINKFFPDVEVIQEACPMWVPLVENNEHQSPGADYFVKKRIQSLLKKNKNIDTVLLACTHYPLLKNKIEEFMPVGVQIVSQGKIVAESLADYLKRHPEIEQQITQNNIRKFYTTDDPNRFDEKASMFYGQFLQSEQITLQ